MPNSRVGRRAGGSKNMRCTLDSERSPSVHYANWKEMMLLGRQLATFGRTERAIVHGITVDQKVAFRRFQRKLQCSKITNARMWSDKEAEIELRDAGMRRLHSESHLLDDCKSDFLSKLEKRPYTAETKLDRETKDKDKNEDTLSKVILQQNFQKESVLVAVTQKPEKNLSRNQRSKQNAELFTEVETHISDIDDQKNNDSKAKISPKLDHTSNLGKDNMEETKLNSEQTNEEQRSQEKSETQMNDSICVEIDEHNVEDDVHTLTKTLQTSTTYKLVIGESDENKMQQGEPTVPCLKSFEPQGDSNAEPPLEGTELNKKENEVCTASDTPDIVDAPVRPRNPRNRIRPGQSSFLPLLNQLNPQNKCQNL